MQASVIVYALVLLPVVLVLFLRTSAAMLFLTLAISFLFVHFLDKDVAGFASSLFGGSTTDTSALSLIFIAIPLVVSAVAFKHSITKNGLPIHLFIAITTGVALLSVIVTYLPDVIRNDVISSSVYKLLQPYTGFSIATTGVVSMALLWHARPKHNEKHKKHGH